MTEVDPNNNSEKPVKEHTGSATTPSSEKRDGDQLIDVVNVYSNNAKKARPDNTDFAPAEVSEMDLYQKRERIYTRKIEGFFQRIRLFTGWPLLLGYFGLPWLLWDGRQAILFDLPARKFYIFGLTFWPQDFSILMWVLALSAFALFFVTTLFGRVWCGYSCPQTVWTSIYMWVEQMTEGSRNQRIRLDKAPWSLSKLRKKLSKHLLWLFVAYLTGFTFVAYFVPIYSLSYQALTWSLTPWPLFWIFFFTLSTYINAGWMREQLCMYACPYARFQSVMFDSNTLVVTYDQTRGEPRGSRKRTSDKSTSDKSISSDTSSQGSCIDCELCKQVCPTGIDIRDGLQFQCIGCALCIDACNSVMDKMGYEKDLIKYSTENGSGGKLELLFRPKVVGYGLAMIIITSLMLNSLYHRIPLELDIIRDRNQLYQTDNRNGEVFINNSYTLKILNKSQKDHTYSVDISELNGATLLNNTQYDHRALVIKAGDLTELPITVSLPKSSIDISNQVFSFIVSQQDNTDANNAEVKTTHETRFLAPSSR